jgi:uncharacterized delta-60 repeat protein
MNPFYSFNTSVRHYLNAQVTGTLDTTFSENGYAIYLLDGDGSFGSQIISQPDGKLIVAERIYNFSALSPVFLRLNADSTLDNSFGSNGMVHIEVDYSNNTTNAILEADGKITLALLTYNVSFEGDPAFVRYTSDGQPDSTFGLNGIVTLNTPFDDSFIEIFTDNDYYLSVNTNPLNNTAYLHGWNDDGTLDINFGTAGTVNISNSAVYDAVQQTDGKLILYGGDFDLHFRRYNTNGLLDSTFGINGIAMINTSGTILIGEIYCDSLNRTYLQYGVDAGSYNFFPRINRFLIDGSQDMTFGTAGDVDFGTEYSISDLDFNVAGKITITGSVDQGDQNGFLIRLLENGSMMQDSEMVVRQFCQLTLPMNILVIFSALQEKFIRPAVHQHQSQVMC